MEILFSENPKDLRYKLITLNDGHEKVGLGTKAGWWGGYWRMRTINGCRNGDWSPIYSTSVRKAGNLQITTSDKSVLGANDTYTPESTVPETGENQIMGSFIIALLSIITGLYALLNQSRSKILTRFEKHITKDLD